MNHPLLIGHTLNAVGSRRTAHTLDRRDAGAIIELARRQAAAGADMLDLCASGLADEPAHLAWLIETVQSATDLPLSLDSPNPAVVRQVLPLCRRSPWLNVCYSGFSQSPEMHSLLRENSLLPVVAVCLDTQGPNVSAQQRLDIACRLASELADHGIPALQIVFDPVTLPVSSSSSAQEVTLTTITSLRRHFPASRILCAVSNASYGLRAKRTIEHAYMAAARTAGADVFLGDPARLTAHPIFSPSPSGAE